MRDQAKEAFTKPSTRSLVLHDETYIETPAEAVWPALFMYNAWNPDHIGAKVVHVAGTRDREGYTVSECKKNGEEYGPPTVIEIVKIIPHKKIVWKLYESGRPDELGFVDFSLIALERRTLFLYNSYSEVPDARFKELPAEACYSVQLAQAFKALKKYVEAL